MYAKINDDGDLVITPLDSTEKYAIKKFKEDWDSGAGALILDPQKLSEKIPKRKSK